jgi:hypothetical protein
MNKPSIPARGIISAIACAGISVLLMRAGFFMFFFLVPLGLCAVVYGAAAAWRGFVFAVLGNAVVSLGFFMRYGMGMVSAGMDILYFTVLALGFTWIMAGSPPRLDIPPVRTVFRFIAASAAAALVFLRITFYSLGGDGVFSAIIRSQIEQISSAYIASSGADAAQQAYMERMLTADRIIEMVLMIAQRGGALVSAFFLFFFSRQMTFILARLFRRQGRRQGGSVGNDLTGFHAPRKTLGVLSLCLPVILLCRMISLELVEIAAWNILVICATMFFAQGGGIVLCALARRPMSVIMRLLCGLLVVCVIFSPGINVLAVGILILLGIAENWLPLRTKKQGDPQSPESI